MDVNSITSRVSKNYQTINESLVSAMSAAILSISERAATELHRGNLKSNMIDCDDGLMVMTQAGESAILVTLVKKDAGMGLIFMLIDSTVKKIAAVLDQ